MIISRYQSQNSCQKNTRAAFIAADGLYRISWTGDGEPVLDHWQKEYSALTDNLIFALLEDDRFVGVWDIPLLIDDDGRKAPCALATSRLLSEIKRHREQANQDPLLPAGVETQDFYFIQGYLTFTSPLAFSSQVQVASVPGKIDTPSW